MVEGRLKQHSGTNLWVRYVSNTQKLEEDEEIEFVVKGKFTVDEVRITVYDADDGLLKEDTFDWAEDILGMRGSEVDFDYRLECDDEDETFIVEGKFTWDGISVSAYSIEGNAEVESWFTWSEVIERKKDYHDDFTYRLVP